MPQPVETADRQAKQGLILDFAGVLTANPLAVHRAWCESEGLPRKHGAPPSTTTLKAGGFTRHWRSVRSARRSGTNAPQPFSVRMSHRTT